MLGLSALEWVLAVAVAAVIVCVVMGWDGDPPGPGVS